MVLSVDVSSMGWIPRPLPVLQLHFVAPGQAIDAFHVWNVQAVRIKAPLDWEVESLSAQARNRVAGPFKVTDETQRPRRSGAHLQALEDFGVGLGFGAEEFAAFDDRIANGANGRRGRHSRFHLVGADAACNDFAHGRQDLGKIEQVHVTPPTKL